MVKKKIKENLKQTLTNVKVNMSKLELQIDICNLSPPNHHKGHLLGTWDTLVLQNENDYFIDFV